MDTETLDKLYLEWSQFTKARTVREVALVNALLRIREAAAKSDPDALPEIFDIATRSSRAYI